MTATPSLRSAPGSRDAGLSPRHLGGPVLVAGRAGDAAVGALRWAELLARRDGVNAHVLGVLPEMDLPPELRAVIDPEALERGRCAKFLDALRRRVVSTVGRSTLFSVEVVSGRPARELAAAARARRSACILVPVVGHGSAERAATDDQVLQVVRDAGVPVIAVPEACALLPKRALVAVDFSESSRIAAIVAARVLGPDGVLTLVHVEPDAELREAAGDASIAKYEEGVKHLFDRLRAEAVLGADTAVEMAFLKGEPADAVLRRASSGDFDLIACGRQGQRRVERGYTGSVSTALLHGAPCAVLIAPPGDETGDEGAAA